ncbi:MAG: CofH family radical SAM protein [Desulfonatronovibrionaceae bacterium]
MNNRLSKVADGQTRLDTSFILEQISSGSVHETGAAGERMRSRLHGKKAFYVYNKHLNYTNVCANACLFCAFSKRRGQSGAYTMDLEELSEQIAGQSDQDISELHIVGGLNPELEYNYYIRMLQAARSLRPRAWIKAFTAVEIAFLADTYGLSEGRVLEDFRAAGLDMLPGGGAEVFAPHLRARICPEKIPGDRWLSIHELAHSMGIKSNCTMLFGHVESWEDRLDHLHALRELQDKSNGFVCFIPLPYQPGNNVLRASGPDGVDFSRMISISRLYLDNIPHIKAYWAFSGIKCAQLALYLGADDFDGTLVRERVGHAAGADSPAGLTEAELRGYIRSAGFEPVRRDALFNPVHGKAID